MACALGPIERQAPWSMTIVGNECPGCGQKISECATPVFSGANSYSGFAINPGIKLLSINVLIKCDLPGSIVIGFHEKCASRFESDPNKDKKLADLVQAAHRILIPREDGRIMSGNAAAATNAFDSQRIVNLE